LYNRIGWIIISANIILFLYLIFSSGIKKIQTGSIAALIMFALLFLLQWLLRNTVYKISLHLFFFISMVLWIVLSNYWLAGAMLLFDLLHTFATIVPVVNISTAYIGYTAPFKRKIYWESLNNCLLKDGLLTIDFKNNKIIQQLIDEKTTKVDEKEFNEFCRKQLITSNQK
jgi:hypothetical protein